MTLMENITFKTPVLALMIATLILHFIKII
ncbi:Uncharacterised protein [Streptococcus pyogenes]|nr:Uncharacterised protein [Streptococcus pyogenes]